jgi:8-oxo-dGTP pyrophosphatase MutT (NUDIX family)
MSCLMRRIAERRTTQREVAEQLGLSVRQVERLYALYKVDGALGFQQPRRRRACVGELVQIDPSSPPTALCEARVDPPRRAQPALPTRRYYR